MTWSARRIASRGGVVGVALILLVTSCHSSAKTNAALQTARGQLDTIHASDLGDVAGQGTYGSAGVSGSRPTAFVAVRTDAGTDSLMTTIGDRLHRAGFSPLVPCRPPAPCTWQRTVEGTLVTANAVVLTAGQPWGEKSTDHGTVAPGSRMLQVAMTVGG